MVFVNSIPNIMLLTKTIFGHFSSLFSEIEATMKKALKKLRSMGKTIVGLHLRRKDYGYGPFFIAPSKWYNECLDNLWVILMNQYYF